MPRSSGPDGLQAMKLNGRIWIATEFKNIILLDAAQYDMLVDSTFMMRQILVLHLLDTMKESSRAQRNLDLEHYRLESTHTSINW